MRGPTTITISLMFLGFLAPTTSNPQVFDLIPSFKTSQVILVREQGQESLPTLMMALADNIQKARTNWRGPWKTHDYNQMASTLGRRPWRTVMSVMLEEMRMTHQA